MAGGFGAAAVALTLGEARMASLFTMLSLFILWTHRENLARLKAGTEPRIGAGR
jgi:glycerol-3-phosphate acyltransferase PlsY